MYKKLGQKELRSILKVDADYCVDALVTFGTYVKPKAYRYFDEALKAVGAQGKTETLQSEFFADVKSLVTPFGRLWFDAIYGCAYASELVHFASLLGAKTIIHVGSFGALQEGIHTGDIAIPSKAFGDESVTRMYSREYAQNFFESDQFLRAELVKSCGSHNLDGSVVSIQAMMGETEKDVDGWSRVGHIGVEMECASVFAVAGHFGVPAAALLYAADNLVTGNLVTGSDYTASSHAREVSRRKLLEAALRVSFGRM